MPPPPGDSAGPVLSCRLHPPQPCFLKDWEMHVHFKVHGAGKKNLHGDGIALWYARDRLVPGRRALPSRALGQPTPARPRASCGRPAQPSTRFRLFVLRSVGNSPGPRSSVTGEHDAAESPPQLKICVLSFEREEKRPPPILVFVVLRVGVVVKPRASR